jgi:predicted lipoprotein
MKRITPVTIVIALAVLVVFVLIGRYGFTVVKIEDVEKAAKSEAFDPATYVDGIWASKIIPAFDQKAVELPKILAEMQPDADGTAPKETLVAIANKYGLITVGEAHVYMVKGSGKIVSVNVGTSLGTVEVTLDGYSGPVKVLLYIGTRIPSDETSVRDAVGFISFGDFKEQTEYGKVTSEINKRVLTQVLGSLDKNSLMGKTISFQGAFTIRTFNLIQIDLKEIKVVPIQIKLGE